MFTRDTNTTATHTVPLVRRVQDPAARVRGEQVRLGVVEGDFLAGGGVGHLPGVPGVEEPGALFLVWFGLRLLVYTEVHCTK